MTKLHFLHSFSLVIHNISLIFPSFPIVQEPNFFAETLAAQFWKAAV